jgi:hypothetical protein
MAEPVTLERRHAEDLQRYIESVEEIADRFDGFECELCGPVYIPFPPMAAMDALDLALAPRPVTAPLDGRPKAEL